MNVNLTGNVNSSTINKIKVLKPIITEAKHYGPHIDAADGALLRDRNASDAITASMSLIVKKIKHARCLYNCVVSEMNKHENQDIKEDFEKIYSKLDFKEMLDIMPENLNKIIANFRNWRNCLISEMNKPENQDIKEDFEKLDFKLDFTKMLKIKPEDPNEIIANFRNWRNRLILEMNKPDNQDIKEDLEKLYSKIDFTGLKKCAQKNLNIIIKNLKNRKIWIEHAKKCNDTQKKIILAHMDNDNYILKCFDTKVPELDEDALRLTTNFKDNYNSFINIYKKNFQIVNNAKKTVEYLNRTYEELQDNETYKGSSIAFATWKEKLNEKLNEKPENINEYKRLLSLVNNFKDAFLEIDNGVSKNPKQIIPYFNQEVYNNVCNKNTEPDKFFNEYKKEYIKSYLIPRYELKKEEEGEYRSFEDNEIYCLNFKKDIQDEGEIKNAIMLLSPDSWCTRSYTFACSHYTIDDDIIFFINKNSLNTIYGGNYRAEGDYLENSTPNNDQDFDFNDVLKIINMLNFKGLPINTTYGQESLGFNLSSYELLVLAAVNKENVDQARAILQENGIELEQKSIRDILIRKMPKVFQRDISFEEIDAKLNLWNEESLNKDEKDSIIYPQIKKLINSYILSEGKKGEFKPIPLSNINNALQARGLPPVDKAFVEDNMYSDFIDSEESKK